MRVTPEWFKQYQTKRGVGNVEIVREAPMLLTLPWPPASGNTTTRHTRSGVHYTLPAIREYRKAVEAICAPLRPVLGQFCLFLHLSPPDARRRDADNAIKVAADALVKCGYLPDDSLQWMRELHVTTDDERNGAITVRTAQWRTAA